MLNDLSISMSFLSGANAPKKFNNKSGLDQHPYPSQDSSIGIISAWYRGGPGFKSWLGR